MFSLKNKNITYFGPLPNFIGSYVENVLRDGKL